MVKIMVNTFKSDRSEYSDSSNSSDITDSSDSNDNSDSNDVSDNSDHIALNTDHSHGEVCSLDPGLGEKVLSGLGLALGGLNLDKHGKVCRGCLELVSLWRSQGF